MKKVLLTFILSVTALIATAQNGITDVLAAGVGAATLYTESYITPAAEAFTYNQAAGWYNDSRALDQWKFKVQIRANGTFSPDEERSFVLDPAQYEALIQESYDERNIFGADVTVTFQDGTQRPRRVATALGTNDPDEFLVVNTQLDLFGVEEEFEIQLAQGLGNAGLDLVPSAFLQAGVGLGFGLEAKVRYTPEIEVDEARIQLLGGGLQWQLSEVLDPEDKLPLEFSVLAAYTRIDALYDFEDGDLIEGTNQRLESDTNSYVFSAIVGTDYKVLNFYGGLNYVTGNTQTDVLGTYRASTTFSGFTLSQTFVDPISVESSVSSLVGTVGTKLSLGFFEISADYTLGAYDTATAALNFKF
ncbi:DUF6588 family protein [Nonlabens ponticola]|uniref:Uncharacterized protein n=1 Tax=Nonlabens ponticola TaxID=2496866 RepID=A0A3S9MWV7_9FLAO|nr:DUF6588 family protein [Nonlabens ponticola]AZQ43701.1 hypothetical protein EJ995_05460 [Nonlabens ponticola]